MSKLKKIDKEFLLTDESVNSYGFRLLTSGYLIDEYKKNPIGYGMHRRDDGVLVRWEDIRLDGDKVWGKPVINLSHVNGQRTVDEIENGFLNAASVGHIVVIEVSEEADLKLDGQTGPTVTKWFNRECSLVDVPGNFNALVKLYDIDDNEINLADFSNTHKMKQIFFTAAQLQSMNLSANADEAAVAAAFNDLVAKAAKADGLQTQLNDLHAQVSKDKVEGLIAAAQAARKITEPLAAKLRVDYAKNPEGLKNLLDAMPSAASENKVADLIAKAVTDRKITKETGDKLAADYKENPEGLKNLLDAMPVYAPLSTQPGGASGSEARVTALMAKSFDDLMSTGESEELAKLSPEKWTEKKKEAGIEK